MNQDEKLRKRQERYAKQEEREKKLQVRREKNTIALVGFVFAVNAFALSFTGWFVWVAFVALLCCFIGIGRKRPVNVKKYLAVIGLALGLLAIVNAVRVSNQWEYDDPIPTELLSSQAEETAGWDTNLFWQREETAGWDTNLFCQERGV